MTVELHIPEGINYECTSCGKCCSGWAVPMTDADYDRISEVDWAELNPNYKNKQLFRELRSHESKDTPYAYKIVSETGTCPFLVDNLCFIHSKNGSEFKPAICQLFPYCFSITPSGVFATVSFVSVGVVYNSGKPLRDQRDVLEAKWNEFRKHYPDFEPDWSHLKLTVDQPITWEEYLEHEKVLLECLNDSSMPLEQRLLKGSAYLVARRNSSNGGSPASTPNLSENSAADLNTMDKHLLATFHKMYFPVKPHRRGDGDFQAMRFVFQRLFGSTKLAFPGQSFSLEELKDIAFPNDDPEVQGVLYRYILSYVFGKKYFGAGFGQVSVIAGYHHLVLLLALIKLHSKGLAKMRGASVVSMMDIVATVRQLERQVGETKLGGYAAAAWELLLYSPKRAQRLLTLI